MPVLDWGSGWMADGAIPFPGPKPLLLDAHQAGGGEGACLLGESDPRREVRARPELMLRAAYLLLQHVVASPQSGLVGPVLDATAGPGHGGLHRADTFL